MNAAQYGISKTWAGFFEMALKEVSKLPLPDDEKQRLAREALESQLADLKKEIAEYEGRIEC